MPAASFSSSEEAVEGFDLKTTFEIFALTSLLLYQLLVWVLFKRVHFVSTSMGGIKGPH
jgi:hypothetical protein